MSRTMAVLIGGALLGILGTLAADRLSSSGNQPADPIIRDIDDVPVMVQAVAEKHRVEQYANLTSVEEVMALPTEFARSGAFYAVAGRSDSAAVQNLIFEADRIADDVERNDVFNILFFRLTEIDPQSALAIARTDNFKAIKSIERTVWRAWARNDLEDALFEARIQTTMAHQNSAAQSLYAAFGYMGNETTERIEAELGIGPDRSSRGRYLYALADRSPGDAIDFINGLSRGTEQQEYVSWLAYYVTLQDPSAALRYADLFRIASDGERYSSIINRNIAVENPHAAIERALAGGSSIRSSSGFHGAVTALASTDLDAVKLYFEQARSSETRQIFGSAIASELAKNDPAEALTWARSNDTEHLPNFEMAVLGRIARADPQFALTEALSTPNTPMRSNMVSFVVQQIAHDNPAAAVAYLDQIEGQQQKLEVSRQLASSWLRQDPDAAIDWILSQDDETAGQMMQMAAHRLVRSDVDAAIRILPRLDANKQQSMRQQIAQTLATNGSPDDAQNFVRQFEGQPGYDRLQASVVSGIARIDVFRAKQLADQLASGSARDSAYVQVIAHRAQTDPAQAAAWLSNVGDEKMRSAAAGQIGAQWYAQDPSAASRWVAGLPAGAARDDTILSMSSRWRESTDEQARLIASIENKEKRGQAKIRRIHNVMQRDPDKARDLLQDDDITDFQRQQVETMIKQYGLRY